MTSDTLGFGVPNITGPHHFIVVIPRALSEPVSILENYGCNGESINMKPVERVVIPRDAWRVIADPLRVHLNARLKELKLKTSRFSIGENKVERVLGQEICVLGWAIEDASEEQARLAFTRWAAYRPEERRWLHQQIVQDAGGAHDTPVGWRLAIAKALIIDEDKTRPRRMAPPPSSTGTDHQPSLFAAAA